MRIDTPLSAEAVSASVATAGQVLKDSLGADLINQTLARLNGGTASGGSAMEAAASQFRTEVSNMMGLGNKLDLMS
ncbi:MAG: hypothetical protein LBV80_01625 [Deltaproteobacteria bacterium]|jgi:hypothetical protein|nr:hypothetical protein [Deltaproteobacteria bacterium]